VRRGTWAGAAFDFSTTPEGTLRVVISQAYEPGKFPWNGRGVSRIYLWNGNYNREDLEGEKPLLNKLMDDVSVEIDSLHVEEFNNGKYGNNVDLENACGRALEAEGIPRVHCACALRPGRRSRTAVFHPASNGLTVT
jgi:hypothetical protein